MITTLAVITATIVGVMVGVEFAVAVFVGPMLRRLPVGSWIEASADGARVLGRVMPFWYIGSLLRGLAGRRKMGRASPRGSRRGRRPYSS